MTADSHNAPPHHHDADDSIEAYCVRDRHTVPMLNPEPVWTSRGTPGVRGICPDCGGVIFRLGASPLHANLTAPDPVQVRATARRPKLPPNTVYLAYPAADEAFAQQLGDDLRRSGLAVWLHDHTPAAVNWAGGVHPAMRECERLLLLLSADAPEPSVQAAWDFFRQKRKPVVIALAAANAPVPDALRRAPRCDLAGDYRTGLRQVVGTLAR